MLLVLVACPAQVPVVFFALQARVYPTKAVEEFDISSALALLKHGTCVKECPSADKETAVECHVTTEMKLDNGY